MKKLENVEVIMPRLIEGIKKWYIEYSCFYDKTNKLEKFRIYKGFMAITDVNERRRYGNKIISTYSKKLTAGWRPWDPNQYKYRDETQYRNVTLRVGNDKVNNSHIRKHLSDFLLETKRRVSAKTYESYQSKTRLFCEWLENNGYANCRIYELKPDVVKNFFNYLIDKRNLDPVTIEKYEQNIGQMFRYFKRQKLTEVYPLEGIIRPPKVKDMAARPLKDNDMRLLLNHIYIRDEQLFLACLFQFFLCCRPGNELRLIKIQDIDLSNNIAHITQESGKTGKRKVTIPDALAELLINAKVMAYPGTNYLFSKNRKPGPTTLGKNYFTRKFVEYRKALNLPAIYKFYSFKHTGAGKLLESGATLSELMSHLGHTSMESTYSYIRRHFGEKSEKVLNFRPDVLKGLV
jgi:integrase